MFTANTTNPIKLVIEYNQGNNNEDYQTITL